MREIAFVAAGGALGALARYAVGLAAAQVLGKGFPWGTLIVNVAGCFVMGIVLQVMASLESKLPGSRDELEFWHKAVAIGFLGGLTTFSSFGADTLREINAGQPLVALGNVAGNVVLSLAAVWCGWALSAAVD